MDRIADLIGSTLAGSTLTGSTLAGLALAGGDARRMGGGDKPLLRLGGLTLLERVIATLQSETALIAISANGDPARFPSEFPVLPDGEGEGPLAGLLAGLDWAAGQGAAVLLTVPGDTPFVPEGLAAALAPAPACATSGGRAHHLVALWPVSVRDALRLWLATVPTRAVEPFAASIGMRQVDFPALPRDPFLNINTPAELAAARQRLDQEGEQGA